MAGEPTEKLVFQLLKIDEPSFRALMWASAAIAFPFIPFRLYVRWRVFHRLFVDDALVVFAYFQLLAFAIMWQRFAGDMYAVYTAIAGSPGGLKQPIANFLYHNHRYMTAFLASVWLYAFSLWSIKLAFLLFFRRLSQNVKHQKIIWRSVLAWNIITFACFMGITNWKCIVTTAAEATAKCTNKKTADVSQIYLKVKTSMDVLSDASIIVLPISLLWKVQIHLGKKLALGSLFSLSVFVMVAAIVRVVGATSTPWLDTSLYFAWAAIEMALAVIVACLASFRVLFTSHIISRPLPNHHEGCRNGLERQKIWHFGFRTMRHTFASISLSDFERDAPATFAPFFREITTYAQPENLSQSLQHDHGVGKETNAISQRSSETMLVPVNN